MPHKSDSSLLPELSLLERVSGLLSAYAECMALFSPLLWCCAAEPTFRQPRRQLVPTLHSPFFFFFLPLFFCFLFRIPRAWVDWRVVFAWHEPASRTEALPDVLAS